MNINYTSKPDIHMEFKENTQSPAIEQKPSNKEEALKAINALSFLAENIDSDHYSRPKEEREAGAKQLDEYVTNHGSTETFEEKGKKINLTKSDFSHGDERLESISLTKEDLAKTRESVNALLDKWEARM